MKIKLPSLFVLLLMLLSACGDFEWFPGANPNVDTTPNQFAFTDQCNVAVSADVVSNTITVAGINSPTIVSIAGGEYSVDNSATYITSNSTITKDGQTVRVRPIGGKLSTTQPNAVITLTIGGVSATFKATTDACVQTTN